MTEPEAPPARRLTIAIAPQTLWLAASIVTGIVLLLLFLRQIVSTLLIIFIAIVLAEGMRPVVQWLSRRARLPRPAGVFALFMVIAAALLGVGWALAAPLVAQATALGDNLPRYTKQAQQLVAQTQQLLRDNPSLASALQSAGNQVGSIASASAGFLIRAPLGFFQGLISLVLIATIAFLWLTSIDSLGPWLLGLLPEDRRGQARDLLHEASVRIGGYVRGVLIDMVVIGVVSGLGVYFLGVPYPLLLGVFAGLTEAIPYLGPIIGGGAAVVVALVTEGPLKALEVLILYEVIQQLEGSLLVPVVMNRTVKLHPLIVVIAVVIGGQILGVIGALLAVPLAVVAQIVVMGVLAPLAWAAQRASPPAASQ